MASGTQLAAKQVEAAWEVGPTEDVVQALMNTLVQPLLPSRVSNVAPPEDEQISVAKQMHAVVLLYNYYHRKQKLELKFLDLAAFCDYAVTVKPPLTAFLHCAKVQLSVTEKAIKNACDIAVALDASTDVPNIEGWPISKVAVLLIDSRKENCFLEFGSVTQGVWSPIEKEVNESINLGQSAQLKVGGQKRKLSGQKASTSETQFLKLAYDAVKDATGYDSCDLEILVAHDTYSLSKAKSATRFYMVKCSGSFNIKQQIPLTLLVESLQGPLAKEISHRVWETTEVVEFHHMLPYLVLISFWLSCQGSYTSIGGNGQSTINSCKEELTPSRTLVSCASKNDQNNLDVTNCDSSVVKAKAISDNSHKKRIVSLFGEKRSTVNILPSTTEDGEVADRFDQKCGVLVSPKHISSSAHENSANHGRQKDKGMLSGLSAALSQKMAKDRDPKEEQCIDVDSAAEVETRVNAGISDTCDDYKEDLPIDPLRGLCGGLVLDDTDTGKINEKCNVLGSSGKEVSSIYDEIVRKDDGKFDKRSLLGPSREQQTVNLSYLTETLVDSESITMKGNSEVIVYHHRRKNSSSAQNSAHFQDGDVCLEDKVDSPKSDHVPAPTGRQLVLLDANTEHSVKVEAQNNDVNAETKSVPASEELQNALALLHRKRQELHSQICNQEDILALYEDCVTRIRKGGEVGLARQCIKCILSGDGSLVLLNHGKEKQDNSEIIPECQHEKQTKVSQVHLPGKSPCEDLEYICAKNNWKLPRYLTEPSHGKFRSRVVIKGEDIDLSCEGSLASTPFQARDTAAADMIAKIRNSFA